jgi:uncharacterized protein
MRSGDLRIRLREQLRAAVRERDRIAVAALRDAIAALDNAEAVEPGEVQSAASSEYLALGPQRPRVERSILKRSGRSFMRRSRADLQPPPRTSSTDTAAGPPISE